MKVLVVDDIHTNRKLLGLMISQIDDSILVKFAKDGDEAVNKYCDSIEDDSHYDIIFMDLMMPKHSGAWAASFIKAKGLYQPKIIFVTAYPEIACTLPELDILKKPVNIQLLQKAIRECQHG